MTASLLCVFRVQAHTEVWREDSDDGSLASENPHIPEPMVFDLVRPLDAKQGEAEINALMSYSLRDRRLKWAPEVEFAFLDGHSVEFQMDMDNSVIQGYQIAFQSTLGAAFDRRLVNGLQFIGRYHPEEKAYSGDGLYLFGWRPDGRWSALNMAGFRIDSRGRLEALINANLFFDWREQVKFGFEFDNEIGGNGRWRFLAIPQLHLDLSGMTTLQAGAGLARVYPGRMEWVASLRLIYAFN